MRDSISDQLNRIEDTVSRLVATVETILSNERQGVVDLSAQLDSLKQKVQQTTEVLAAVQTLVNGLAQQIRDNKDDPAALEAMATELDNDNAGFRKLVTDNTPAAPGAQRKP